MILQGFHRNLQTPVKMDRCFFMEFSGGVIMGVIRNLIRFTSAMLLLITAMAVEIPAQSDVDKMDKNDMTPEEIIKKFTEKESEFYKVWMNYAYTQNVRVRILSVDGKPSKEWMDMVSEVVFDDDGSRDMRLISRKGGLRAIVFTREDEEIINNINPFALTTVELPLYDLKYEGKERVDELDCHVFSAKPKNIKRGRLYFEGKIWVDDVDFQVVRTAGRAVPQTDNNLFPEFETLRQLIDGKFWFPVWTHADERLRFPDKTVRIEETITYDDYREFKTKSTIRYENIDGENETGK